MSYVLCIYHIILYRPTTLSIHIDKYEKISALKIEVLSFSKILSYAFKEKLRNQTKNLDTCFCVFFEHHFQRFISAAETGTRHVFM